jgi:ATP-binding cassette subfamily F protein 3
MILLDAADIEKRFGPQPVLDGLSLQLRPGERAGLVGPNGSGKTTLLRILAGHEEADRGRVERHPALRLGYLEQQPEWQPGRTLWDEARTALADLIALEQESVAVAGQLADSHEPVEHRRLAARYDHLQHELQQRDAYNLDHKIERVLDGLRFPRAAFAQPVESLSGGEQNRLMLAKLLLTEPNVMLLDEPSNHLDIEATEWLETFLIDSSAAMIVVSHDRYFLDRVTQRTFELFQGTVESYTGNFSAYWQQKAERLLVQRRTYEKQQTEIAKTEDFIRRNHYGQKHAQAEDRRKKLERIERVPPPREITAPPMGFPPATRSGDLVVRAHALGKGYNVPLFAGLDLQITRGQRWGLLGPNGSGKTTLLRCLLGLEPPDEGTAELGQSVACAYFDQHLAGLDEELAVVDAVARPDRLTTTQQRRDLLARFGVTGDTALQTVNRLSGGERCRAALARLAAVEANLLVLDEPTNHLDLWARDALERALTAFDGTVLFVSHDRYFLNRVADHLLIIEPGRVRLVEGNYDAYQLVLSGRPGDAETRGRGDTGTGGQVDAGTRRRGGAETRGRGDAGTRRRGDSGAAGASAKTRRRFPFRKIADIEKEIFRRESHIEEINRQLGREETCRDGQLVRRLKSQRADEQEALKTLYAHWEEANELNW